MSLIYITLKVQKKVKEINKGRNVFHTRYSSRYIYSKALFTVSISNKPEY